MLIKARQYKLRKLLDKWPGKRLFGPYRFLPFFYLFGAGLEFFMIKVHIGEANFYKVYRRNRSREAAAERFNEYLLTKK